MWQKLLWFNKAKSSAGSWGSRIIRDCQKTWYSKPS